ncbi:VIT family protein [Rhizobium pusense]|uniref:VIT family protein n=1 Tax=Agrobacterium pusense TaxID=648995 RepID=A0A6H0ZG35_9HYPH|nr:VIT family protein [Agrobacterium pusense]MDH2092114.1 VIT family protein [Agrobacterium pusense]QCM13946.1 VIT family protein [Agrobacterium tumefaciens]QIX19808.1 VIT family protein [Agrobacterium pusense]WCK27589.1 VIT family protein [Agrobacterium pusense]
MHRHIEKHAIERIGWLRAAVLGANDGIISTASLMVGVASASTSASEVLVAGFASLAAGAMAMAAGEYVSVSSQADTEAADLERERRELETQPEHELIELAEIYEARGVSKELALEVAKQLTAHDALGAHARDELGITDTSTAQPVQAALTSAFTFSAGAIVPVLTALLAPPAAMQITIPMVSLLFLAGLGALSARAGGAGIVKPTIRVAFWGALAMVTTGLVGALIGKAI